MFVDFDKVFHPEQKWQNTRLTDRNPCTHCKVTKEYHEHRYQVMMSIGFEDEILKPCKVCKDYLLWQIDCYHKLQWYEEHDERLKL